MNTTRNIADAPSPGSGPSLGGSSARSNLVSSPGAFGLSPAFSQSSLMVGSIKEEGEGEPSVQFLDEGSAMEMIEKDIAKKNSAIELARLRTIAAEKELELEEELRKARVAEKRRREIQKEKRMMKEKKTKGTADPQKGPQPHGSIEPSHQRQAFEPEASQQLNTLGATQPNLVLLSSEFQLEIPAATPEGALEPSQALEFQEEHPGATSHPSLATPHASQEPPQADLAVPPKIPAVAPREPEAHSSKKVQLELRHTAIERDGSQLLQDPSQLPAPLLPITRLAQNVVLKFSESYMNCGSPQRVNEADLQYWVAEGDGGRQEDQEDGDLENQEDPDESEDPEEVLEALEAPEDPEDLEEALEDPEASRQASEFREASEVSVHPSQRLRGYPPTRYPPARRDPSPSVEPTPEPDLYHRDPEYIPGKSRRAIEKVAEERRKRKNGRCGDNGERVKRSRRGQ